LYFFRGSTAAVVSHGLVKEREVPPREIDLLWNENDGSKRIRKCIPTRRFDMANRSKRTSDAVEIVHRRYYEGKPNRLKGLDEARANEEIARKIYELRMAAGLTQTQLAKLIGTTASVICRLEDADYEGHSLAMLRKIGGALNQRVEIRFIPIRRSA
jgi:DNA-binding XRE family transcriptional regulator